MTTLNYHLFSKYSVSLDLYEAEFYENAVVVQPLIGNLVRYSNMGRYEPFLAETWEMISQNAWKFTLKKNLVCEDGEQITPESFKTSLELSIKKLSKSSPPAILSDLVGYSDFIAGSTTQISGIKITSNEITFEFTQPILDGVVQILSFAPFGYICAGNRDQTTGEWKDPNRFISSGPYHVVESTPAKTYKLGLREGFGSAASPSLVTIQLSNVDNESISLEEPAILDNSLSATTKLLNGEEYPLVPEYLNYVALSPNGSFANEALRMAFVRHFNAIKFKSASLYPKGHTIANSFYPSMEIKRVPGQAGGHQINDPIRIMGKEPTIGVRAMTTWRLVKQTLQELGWPYEFTDRTGSHFDEHDSKKYDLRIGSSSIGGGVEQWGIAILFCSDFGPRLPDPTGKVCELLKKPVNEYGGTESFSKLFEQAVYEGNAIVPVVHYGVNMSVTSGVSADSMSPLLSIVRFDELKIRR